MTKRFLGIMAALLTSCLVVSACGGDSDTDEINIGVLTACSGVFAVACDPIKDGVEFWLEQNDGRIGGREVKLTVADEKSTTEGVVNATNELIRRHKVEAIVGMVDSSGALAVRPTLTKNKIITIDTLASPPGLLDPEGAPYLFMVTAPPEATAAAAAVLAESQGWQDVAILADNFVGARAWADPLVDALRELDVAIDSQAFPAFPTSDYAPYLTKISNSDAQLVVPVMFGASASSMFQTYRSMGIEKPAYTTGSMLEPTSVSKDLMELAEGSFAYWNYSPSLNTDANVKFVDGFEAAYGRTPGGFEMQAYVGMEFLNAAYTQAGKDADADDVQKALREVEIESPVGALSLGSEQAVLWDLYLTKVAEGPKGDLALVPVGPYIERGAQADLTVDEARQLRKDLPADAIR